MSNIAIQVENISKAYQLGEIGTGTISRDLERWIAKMRGKEDPFLRIGETNDRTTKSKSNVVWSLEDINFEINQGDAVAIIGRNGAGKSTLLKILSRVTAPTTGRISGKGRMASLLEVGTGFHPELTGRENIYLNGAILGMRKKEIERKFDQILDFSGVERYVDTPVKRYSSGMYVRLAFAVAAHLESEILIVDEVLAVGDADFQKKCLGKMSDISKGEGRTVLFVSHNMSAVKRLCSKGIYLKNGHIEYIGNINSVIEAYIKESKAIDLDEGRIPEGRSTYNSGVLRFTKAVINGSNLNTASYDELITICLEIFSKEDVSNCFMDVRFVNNELLEITHSSHAYHSVEKFIEIKKGFSKFEVEIDNKLQPGNYYITIGVHKENGDTLDFIEFIGPVEVMAVSNNDSNDFVFPSNWPLAYVRLPSKWSQIS